MSAERAVDLLDRVLEPVAGSLTPEAARRLAALRADPVLQSRIDDLADRSEGGKLSEDEKVEYETFVAASNFLAILQAKARRILTTGAS